MFRNKAGKGDGQVKTERNVASTVIVKTEYLLFGFPVAFAQQHFGIFQSGGVDGYKPSISKYIGNGFD